MTTAVGGPRSGPATAISVLWGVMGTVAATTVGCVVLCVVAIPALVVAAVVLRWRVCMMLRLVVVVLRVMRCGCVAESVSVADGG